MIIKVCGMKDGENIRRIEHLGADMIGFIFYPPSPRYVDALPGYMPQIAKRVGVFVNERTGTIFDKATAYGLDYIQLHGDESPGICSRISAAGLKVIKAFRVGPDTGITALTAPYDGSCDYFLFDTESEGYGGSGKAFAWNILDEYTGRTPFLLSGGIGADDAGKIKSFNHPRFAGTDLNSRFEISPGIKDEELLQKFINEIKNIRS